MLSFRGLESFVYEAASAFTLSTFRNFHFVHLSQMLHVMIESLKPTKFSFIIRRSSSVASLPLTVNARSHLSKMDLIIMPHEIIPAEAREIAPWHKTHEGAGIDFTGAENKLVLFR